MTGNWPFVLLLAGVLPAGCHVPRSASVGQTAAPVRPGGGEAGLAVGVSYQRAEVDGSSPGEEVDASELGIPVWEGRVLFGLGERVGLDVHVSEAGLQPGVKVTVVDGEALRFALLPAVAFGYGSASQGAADVDAFLFLAGLKAIVSSASGVYGAVGYDFQKVVVFPEPGSDESSSYTLHNLLAAVGLDVGSERVRLRPELAVGYAPSISFEDPDAPDMPGPDASALHLFPNVSVVVIAP